MSEGAARGPGARVVHGHAWGVRCTVGRSVWRAGGGCIWVATCRSHRDHMCARSAARAACGCRMRGRLGTVFAHSAVLAATGVAGCTRLISDHSERAARCGGARGAAHAHARARARARVYAHAHARARAHLAPRSTGGRVGSPGARQLALRWQGIGERPIGRCFTTCSSLLTVTTLQDKIR
jgi:hypothetical protein